MKKALLIFFILMMISIFIFCSKSTDSGGGTSGNFYRLDIYPPITTESPCIVNIMFQVTDEDGFGVTGLTTDDFDISEDNDPVSPTESFPIIRPRENIPYTLKTVLMLDNSASVGANLEEIKNAAKALINNITDQQEFAIYKFSDEPELVQDFTNRISSLTSAINSISLGYASTDLYGAVVTGVSKWSDYYSTDSISQGFMILLTDGSDTQHSTTLNHAISARGNKRVYTIGLGNEIEPDKLDSLGNAGFYSISSVSQVAEKFDEIQEAMIAWANSFYWLYYMSPTRTGSHTLRLEVDGNTNQGTDSDINGSFSSSGFYSVLAGLQIKAGSDQTYGRDTIYFDDYNDPITLTAGSFYIDEFPEYQWSASDNNIVIQTLNENSSIASIHLSDLITDYESITIEDINNDMSTEITVVFNGNGSVQIIPQPNELMATYTVTGPESFSSSRMGTSTIEDALPGDYTVTWNEKLGWTTPTAETKTLTPSGSLVFYGNYEKIYGYGTIIVSPLPEDLNLHWSFSGPEGYSRVGYGCDTLSDMIEGDYTITWDNYTNWITPEIETATLNPDDTLEFIGQYEEATGTIIISSNPDHLNAEWLLLYPSDQTTINGNGTDTLYNMAVGNYTISWTSYENWITPPAEVKVLNFEETITFMGAYQMIPEYSTMTDIDGNTYTTVKIGDQWWMAENLKVTHYRNGEEIPNITDNTEWANLTSGAYCDYDNNPNNVATYGRLYNWYSIEDSRDLAPDGWHVPSRDEWQTMIEYLGGDGIAGGKLKESGTEHWLSPNEGATNESGFSALPSGMRGDNAHFYSINEFAFLLDNIKIFESFFWFKGLY